MKAHRAACGLLVAAAAGTVAIATDTGSTPTRTVSTPPIVTAHSGCVAHGGLPDASCTPGATNPNVTQATINQTICVRGWTATIRPPVSVTQPIKAQVEQNYGIPAPHPHPFVEEELDHELALEIGGAPADIRNLWPQPAPAYHMKDLLENALHAEICSGKTPLVVAQHEMATDWIAASRSRGLPVP